MNVLESHPAYEAWEAERKSLDARMRVVNDRLAQARGDRIEQEQAWQRAVDRAAETGEEPPPLPPAPDVSGDELLVQRLMAERQRHRERRREVLAEIREDVEEQAREAEQELFARLRPLVEEIEGLVGGYRRDVLGPVLEVRSVADPGTRPSLVDRSTSRTVSTQDVMDAARRDDSLLRLAPPPRPTVDAEAVEVRIHTETPGGSQLYPDGVPEWPRGRPASHGLMGR